MGEFPILEIGKSLWQSAERSQIGRFVRSLTEVDGINAVKDLAAKGMKQVSETTHQDMVVLSDAVKKMRKGGNGNSGAPAEVFVPKVVEFPGTKKQTHVPQIKFPGVGGKLPIEMPERPLHQDFPGIDIPPEFPNNRWFPGLDEEGGAMPVILPPKDPKRPPLVARQRIPELVH